MNEECLSCEWYNKPYWSIISPCANCPKKFKNSTIKTDLYKEMEQLQQENQQLIAEVKELELIIGLRQKSNLIHKFDKEYDEEDKRKNLNRDYAGIMPDAEEVYRRYYEQQERIKGLQQENQQLKEKYLNAVADYESEKSKNHNAIEHINKFEDIKAYYSYEEDGYEEYNYDEDFKIDLLEILEGGD